MKITMMRQQIIITALRNIELNTHTTVKWPDESNYNMNQTGKYRTMYCIPKTNVDKGQQIMNNQTIPKYCKQR